VSAPVQGPPEPLDPSEAALESGQVDLGADGGSSDAVPDRALEIPDLGRRAIQGVLITTLFAVAWELIRAGTGLLTVRFLQPEDYALAGVAIQATGVANTFLNMSIETRLVQVYREPGDAYDYGFTLLIWVACGYAVLAVVAGLVASRLYGNDLIVPLAAALAAQGFIAAASLPAVYLQREMRWWKQRIIYSAGPSVGIVVTLVLAMRGFGAWAVIIGSLVTGAVSATIVWVQAPRKPRFRRRVPRDALRFFFSFGWPLWLGGVIAVLATNGMILEVKIGLGLAMVGAFRLATTLGNRIDTAEGIVAGVLFPVLSRTRDIDRLRRAYVVSARMILVWAVPVGFGLALFATDVVRYVVGQKWSAVTPLLWVEGIGEAFNAIGTMWGTFYTVLGRNRPSLWLGLQINIMMVVLIGVLMPFLHYEGVLLAISAAIVVSLVQRRRYLKKLFPDIPVIRVAVPYLAAATLAVGVVLALGAGYDLTSRTGLALRLVCYFAVYGAAVFALQRGVLAESLAMLRQSRGAA
jgi:O-antigen/teichoic acid export membrane protein